jgi:hypothetical protein
MGCGWKVRGVIGKQGEWLQSRGYDWKDSESGWKVGGVIGRLVKVVGK